MGVSELRVSPDKTQITVVFDTGQTMTHAAYDLRLNAPSADVQGHGGQKPAKPSVPKNVTIADLELVGHYAVRIAFSDGHDKGIYTWAALSKLVR